MNSSSIMKLLPSNYSSNSNEELLLDWEKPSFLTVAFEAIRLVTLSHQTNQSQLQVSPACLHLLCVKASDGVDEMLLVIDCMLHVWCHRGANPCFNSPICRPLVSHNDHAEQHVPKNFGFGFQHCCVPSQKWEESFFYDFIRSFPDHSEHPWSQFSISIVVSHRQNSIACQCPTLYFQWHDKYFLSIWISRVLQKGSQISVSL